MTNNAIIQPYLFFDGKCEEAIEFYKKVLGAEVDMLLRYKDSPEPPPPGCGPTDPNKVDRKSTRLNSSHLGISYAVFCLKKTRDQPLPFRRRGGRDFAGWRRVLVHAP